MALDLTLKTRKRALEKENEPLDMSTRNKGNKPPPLDNCSSPSKASTNHYKKLAIANWTWSKYKKHKLEDVVKDDGESSPKRISPDLPR